MLVTLWGKTVKIILTSILYKYLNIWINFQEQFQIKFEWRNKYQFRTLQFTDLRPKLQYRENFYLMFS